MMHPLIPSVIHLLIRSLIDLYIHSFTDPFIHSLIEKLLKTCLLLLVLLPFPPLANSRVSAERSPGGGGRRSPSDGLPGGGGGCKGISRQTVVPSTNASKENTCEATFALMRWQCVSSNTNVIEDPKER